jgi:DNA-binding response OmpR family regulator
VEILVLTAQPTTDRSRSVLPAIELLAHTVRTAGHDVRSLLATPAPDAVLIDARHELAEARGTCRMVRATGLGVPLIAVVEEARIVAVSADWGLDDVILTSAGPAEVDARLRLAVGRLRGAANSAAPGVITAGDLTIDPDTYAARLKGRPLSLTYKEFELLKFLAQQPGRVFSRDQLLREVWGYDYFGGTRTVDVHVRRLRAKLGSSYESMIGTVRQVGYKLTLPTRQPMPALVDELEAMLNP